VTGSVGAASDVEASIDVHNTTAMTWTKILNRMAFSFAEGAAIRVSGDYRHRLLAMSTGLRHPTDVEPKVRMSHALLA
jgi:hypothetical protein